MKQSIEARRCKVEMRKESSSKQEKLKNIKNIFK